MTDSLHSQSENNPNHSEDNELGRALLVGIFGGLLSAAGYVVYRRLPEEQKERLHQQVRSTLSERISDIRRNFNL